ncbi:Septation protein imp2 [Wickerhamiella sorbophila]|uniref:Septation protein imp2 n=1 Tax=Wickerhamiella sorbophila TaxID=45607 RepID=A0A2T0FK70_9ASCO|nr:Septation protein imp2 [Wickerhamiella sorbophila]PRT55394.1 Septation protein imp2 [Wickerhamiella sorbophila]
MEPPKTFANNFWGKDDVGYTRLLQRMHHAKQTCEEVQTFYKERQAIEEEYARKLLQLSRRALGENETGSLKESLNTVRSTTAAMAKSHEAEALQISTQLLKPLQAFAASMRERRRQGEDAMVRLTKTKANQNTAAEKSRNKYEQEAHNITGYLAQQNLLMGRDLDKNNQKLERSRMAVDGLQRQYRDNLKMLSETIDHWNHEWKNTCDRFQTLEEERIDFLKSNLWAYANVVSSVCVSDDEGCEVIRVALEKCESSKDIADFIEFQGTGSHIQDPPEFCNFMGGFSRDDGEGAYRVANFSRDGAFDDEHEDDRSQNESMFDTSYYGSHGTETGGNNAMKNVPELVPASDDGYASSSPSHLGTSPHSSIYSNSIGGSPDFQTAANFNPIEVTAVSKPENAVRPTQMRPAAVLQQPQAREQKRRSWAMPFKRQSTPDLSKIWQPSESERNKFSDSSAFPAHTDVRQAPPSAATTQDPLLVAVERLKAESTTRPAKTRPMSMPGINTLHQQSASGPYGNGRATTERLDSSVSRKSPTRKEVGAGMAQNGMYSASAASPQGQPMRYHHALAPQQAKAAQYAQYSQQVNQQQTRRPRSKSTVEARDSRMQLPTRTTNGMRVIRYSRAQYDYRAAIPEEVSFRKGDILLVTVMQEDGWWEVEVLGKNRFGLAPSNFLVSV